MNGTALRKPTARRVVGMVAGIVIIALGTFVNGICIGYIVTAFYDPIHAHFGDAPSLAV